jgi:serine/threonine-protein kinase PRP4
MEVKGKLNHRMIKKATLGEMHFDEQLNFISIEQDKITRQVSCRDTTMCAVPLTM